MSPAIIFPDKTLVKYIDKLQKQNAEHLAFYPLRALEDAMDRKRILLLKENDDHAGYLWHGALWNDRPIVIYQACIDYDLRRRHLGFQLVRQLIEIAKAAGAPGLRCRVASSAESNDFWQAIGFYCFDVTEGGVKRKRAINHYRLDFVPNETIIRVQPSRRPTDLKSYQADKRAGIEMPNRFQRNHYGGAASEFQESSRNDISIANL